MKRGLLLGTMVVLLLPACGPQNTNYSIPRCNEFSDSLVLAAQSVPTATKIPCLGALPAGWSRGPFQARDGSATFTLDSDRAGIEAVEVTLQRTCDFSQSTQVQSDELGTDKFDHVDPIDRTYSGVWYYLFDGGCVSYEFEFRGSRRTALIEDVKSALSFVDRNELRMEFADRGLTLDP